MADDSTSVHDEPMDSSCNPGPHNQTSDESSSSASTRSAESDATTPASEWTAPADATPGNEQEVRAEFEEGIRKIFGDDVVVTDLAKAPKKSRGQVKLDDIAKRLRDCLDQLGRAMHKLETVRKDRHAAPEVTFDAAQARRQLEADANDLMNQYLSEVVRQQGGSE